MFKLRLVVIAYVSVCLCEYVCLCVTQCLCVSVCDSQECDLVFIDVRRWIHRHTDTHR